MLFGVLSAQQQREGIFIADDPGTYPVSGTAAVQFLSNGTKRVIFKEDFITIQGLRLEVFLSTSANIATGSNIKISTQQLQDDNGGTDMNDPITGFKIFEVPNSVTITDYSHIIIQCTQANLLWGSVALGANTSINHCERDGVFVANDPGTYPVTGSARIEFLTDGTKHVIFDKNFATVQGLQLEVFLAKTGILNLVTDVKISTQQLQDDNGGTNMNDPITGYIRFVVPAGVELEDFDNILIQCTQANILWGNVVLSSIQGSGCSVLSVAEQVLNDLLVYPIPAREKITISSNKNKEFTVRMTNTSGTIMLNNSRVKANSFIDMSKYPIGVYFLEIGLEDIKSVKQIIIN